MKLATARQAAAAWADLTAVLGEALSLEPTQANADRMMALADALVALRGSKNEPSGAASLLMFVTAWITQYESAHVPMPEVPPAEMLAFLMDSNGLRQRDLAQVFGGQSVVSLVLRGKRQISAKQAVALGKRFSMSPAAFLAEDVVDAPISVLGNTETRTESTGSIVQVASYLRTEERMDNTAGQLIYGKATQVH